VRLLAFASGYQDPWWVYPAVGGVLLALWLLNRIANHFFPSTRKKYGTSVGNALMRIEGSFLPGREHIAEAHEHEHVDEDDQGEPPETGNGRLR